MSNILNLVIPVTMTERMRLVFLLADAKENLRNEQERHEPSEAVIYACEMAIRCYEHAFSKLNQPLHERINIHIELSQPKEKHDA